MKCLKKEILADYQNGNYHVVLFGDGTKVKETEDDYFDSEFPDSIDMKITNYCDLGCVMCHENSSTSGIHGDVNHNFLNSLHRGTEVAIGGGNPLAHPKLYELLLFLKEKGIIANLTVNERHLVKDMNLIQKYIDQKLIYGLGISLNQYSDETIDFCMKNPNCVIHLIIGMICEKDLLKLINKNLKLLLLGYKKFGRGENFYTETILDKIKSIENILFTKPIIEGFESISFDNLALEQLNVKDKVSKVIWENTYMGDDGESSLYVDLVEKKFGKNSTSVVRYDLLDNINDMMKIIKEKNNK